MILRDPQKLKVYLRLGNTDMRKSWNGLYDIIQEEMNLDPYSRSLFLVNGHSRKLNWLLRGIDFRKEHKELNFSNE